MDYEVVIGLETHIEQNTKTKMFCSCKNEFGGAPNTNCCEVCTAMPGALPVINRQAVYNTIKAGLATNCEISKTFYFDRKGYFYPDLAKAYQISQLYVPICKNGKVEFEVNGKQYAIRLNRIHLEEDAGKLVHGLFGETLVDFNRGGVPLMEIVTEPDFRSVEQVMAYLDTIKNIFKAIGVSECRMERGQLRCDVNVSLRPFGSPNFGTRTEMKNLNSFKAIERAIKFEISRQTKILNSGGKIVQETLRWDDVVGQNYPMRSKEDSQDYRYFPDPDLLPITITDEEIKKIKNELPVLPAQLKSEYKKKYGFSDYDATQLSKNIEISKFFEECVKAGIEPREASNWIQGEISNILNEQVGEEIVIKLVPINFAKLIGLYKAGEISQASARQVLRKIWDSNEDPGEIVEKQGLKALSDDTEIRKIVEEIISKNPNAVNDYKSGNKKALAFFVGQTMKATQGKANAGIVNKIIIELLGE